MFVCFVSLSCWFVVFIVCVLFFLRDCVRASMCISHSLTSLVCFFFFLRLLSCGEAPVSSFSGAVVSPPASVPELETSPFWDRTTAIGYFLLKSLLLTSAIGCSSISAPTRENSRISAKLTSLEGNWQVDVAPEKERRRLLSRTVISNHYNHTE